MSENLLIGGTIRSITLSQDKMAIRFIMDDGAEIIANCGADCCSLTWIENVENAEAAVGSPVLVAEDINMPDLGNMPDRDVVSYYGFRISTLKGECTIDYRNDSNGYYGGNLSWPEDAHYYGGVHDQNVSKENWQKPLAEA